MTIEPWHVSIFVTAGIVLAELGVHAVLRNVGDGAWHKRVRTVALVLLVGLTLVVAVAALGPTMADKLASVASAVAAVAAAWLAYLSYHASRSGDLSGTGAPPKDKSATTDPIPGDDDGESRKEVTEQDAVAG